MESLRRNRSTSLWVIGIVFVYSFIISVAEMKAMFGFHMLISINIANELSKIIEDITIYTLGFNEPVRMEYYKTEK